MNIVVCVLNNDLEFMIQQQQYWQLNILIVMNFMDFIEVELRNLQKEALSINKNVSNKTNKLLEHIIIIKQNQKPNKPVEEKVIHQNLINELLNILLTVFETKNIKLNLHGLSILQKIMNIKHLQIKHYEQIISKLILIKNTEDSVMQLKLIQTTLNLIAPHLIDIQNYQFIIKIYTICFQISIGKEFMTQKISISALLQLTQIIFLEQKFQKYSQTQIANSFNLLRDFLSYLLEIKVITWIPKGMIGIVWDLVMEIVKYQGQRICKDADLVSKLQKIQQIAVSKSFLKIMENKYDFIRFFRAYCYIICHIKIGFKYLDKMNVINEIQPGFVYTTYVEGLLMIISHKLLFQYYDNNPEFLFLFEVVSKVAEQLCISNQKLKISDKKLKYLLQVPTINLNINIEKQQLTDDATLFKMLNTGLAELRANYSLYVVQISNNQIAQKLNKGLQKISPRLIKCYRYLISIQVEEDYTRKLIQQFQLWFLICSKLSMGKSRNKFLQELFCLTNKIQKKFNTIKCAQAIQIMFNLIYGYQDFLDISSLTTIFRSFQFIEQNYYKLKNNKQWELQIGFELEQKIIMINNLFDKNFIHLTQFTLKNNLKALNQITKNILQELAQSNNPDTYSMRLKTFGLRKLKVIIENHSKNLGGVWDTVVTHFLVLCCCKYKQIRMYTIQILSQIVKKLLDHKSIEDKHLFQIYLQIVKTKYFDVKIIVIEKLINFIINRGYKIDEKSLIEILKILNIADHSLSTKKNQEYDKFMEEANQLNQLIIKQCLINIHTKKCLSQLISSYKIIQDNKNHQYSGVGLFWLIADHHKSLWLKKQLNSDQFKEFEKLENQILINLYKFIIKNEFHEVRQSGIHSITQIIASNLHLYQKQNIQQRITDYLQLFKQIISKYKAVAQLIIGIVPFGKQGKQSNDQKQWYETCKSIYSNLLKLFKKLKTQNTLEQKNIRIILEQINQNLSTSQQLKMFYFQTLNFLYEFKKEIIKSMQFPLETQIKNKLLFKLNNIDNKQRINRNKIIPTLQSLLQLYQTPQ